MTPTYARSITWDFDTGIILFWDEEPYVGPWELGKKGRESQQKVTDTALQNAGTDQATRVDQLGHTNTDIGSLEAQSTPGSLSPAAEAQLAADQRKIGDTYAATRRVGLQRIAQHGMGTLTGEASSAGNSADMAQAHDELAAHEQAQLNTHADRIAAINARSGLQNIYDPNKALSTGAQSAYDQSHMGSTLGDIGSGISTGIGLASQIALPGSGGLKSLTGLKSGG